MVKGGTESASSSSAECNDGHMRYYNSVILHSAIAVAGSKGAIADIVILCHSLRLISCPITPCICHGAGVIADVHIATQAPELVENSCLWRASADIALMLDVAPVIVCEIQ